MSASSEQDKKLYLVMAALAESVATASDKELLDDAEATPDERRATATRVRGVLDGAILKARKALLERARQDHAFATAVLRERSSRIPQDSATRRLLLNNVIARRPEMQKHLVTFQHREFESFTDGDVESALRHLDALGALDDEEARDT